jgi:hypothetical protein
MANRTPNPSTIKPSADGRTDPHGDAREGDAREGLDFDPEALEAEASGDRPQAPTAPNPFDPARYRLDEGNLADLGITDETADVPVTRPKADWWVRVHPGEEYRQTMGFIETKTDRELYLVDRDLWPRLKTEPLFHFRRLHLAVNTEGQHFIWPCRLPNSDGKIESWVEIPLRAVEHAKKTWTRFFWEATTRKNRIRTTDSDYAEVKWPNLSFAELLGIAFNGRIISDLEHPILCRLLRGSPTNG